MGNPGDANSETAYKNTGAVEQDRPEQKTNVAPLKEQLDHQYQDPLNKQSDSGMAERGQNPEFAGESQGRNELDQDTNANLPGSVKRELEKDRLRSNRMDATNDTDQNAQDFNSRSQQDTNVEPSSNRRGPDGNNPEGDAQDQDPGQRQRKNQGEKKDDDLAA